MIKVKIREDNSGEWTSQKIAMEASKFTHFLNSYIKVAWLKNYATFRKPWMQRNPIDYYSLVSNLMLKERAQRNGEQAQLIKDTL